MRIKRTDFFKKLWSLSSLLENRVLISRFLGPEKNYGVIVRKWRKNKIWKKNERGKGNWCQAWGRLRRASWLGDSICNAKAVFHRNLIRLLPILKQVEKLYFQVLNVSHNVVLCNRNRHCLHVYHPRFFPKTAASVLCKTGSLDVKVAGSFQQFYCF